MDTSWLTPSLVVALLSLWIAYTNYRSSNYALMKIHHISCSFPTSLHENNSEMFAHLQIAIRNTGIPLHNIQLALEYRGSSGHGSIFLPFHTSSGTTLKEGQFAKGMIADFYFKTYQLDRAERRMLADIINVFEQDVRICLYADGFRVWELKLRKTSDLFKSMWNRLAYRFNSLFTRESTTRSSNIPIIKEYHILPKYTVVPFHLEQLAKYIRQETAAGSSST